MSDASLLFAVAFDSDGWLTSDQLDAFERVLLGWVRPQHSEKLASALRSAESVCLDTALLGMIIAHESGGYSNRLYWGEFGPQGKMEAGWPTSLWLPPRRLDDDALDLLCTRLVQRADADRAVDWARWQLENWWRFAAIFEPGAVLSGVHDDGTLVVNTLASPAMASRHTRGEVLVESPPTHSEPRCAATWTVHVVGERIREVQDGQCLFPARYGV